MPRKWRLSAHSVFVCERVQLVSVFVSAMSSMAVSFYNIQHFHEKVSVYTCCLYKKDLNNVENFFGQHLKNKHGAEHTNDDVRGIALSHCKLSTFPRELSQIFPNIDHLSINGGISAISKDDLVGFEKLKFLDLQSCEITSLPSDLFEHTPNLEVVYVSHNKITSIGERLLEPLHSLKYLNLHGNTGIDAVYDENKQNEFNLDDLKSLIRQTCHGEKLLEDNGARVASVGGAN